MKILTLCLLLWCVEAQAAFTSFYCNNTPGSAGTNRNAGSTASATPIYSCNTGNWDGTSVYTPTDGSTPASSVTAGDFVSICTNTLVRTFYVARVASVAAGVNGAITIVPAASAGTAPVADTAGNLCLIDGGCWHGPGTADQVGGSGGSTNYFPFDFVAQTLTNTSSQCPRVNILGGTTYTITNSMVNTKSGPLWFMGYTNTPGDGGFAVFNGPATGASFSHLNIDAGGHCTYANLVFDHNGNSGGGNCGITNSSGGENFFWRVVVADMTGAGIFINTAFNDHLECEVYKCNSANTANMAGFQDSSGSSKYVRCNSHDNTGGINAIGFTVGDSTIAYCSSWNNSAYGIKTSSAGCFNLFGCNLYNNTFSGLSFSSSTAGVIDVIQNCNFFKNAQYAVDISPASTLRTMLFDHCNVGSGTQTNGLGMTSAATGALTALFTNAITTFAANATPWVDPTNGNFTPLSSARATGAGGFMQYLVNSPTNTVSYPDIGAAQSAGTNSAAAGGAYTFAQ